MTSFRTFALSLTTLLPSCTCFIGSTRVQTPGGPRPISQLKVGDWVLSQELSSGRVVSARVVRCFAHSKRPFGRILGTSLCGVTSNHPIYVPHRNTFVRADRIGPEEHLVEYAEGQVQERKSFGYDESPAAAEPVFNVEVEKTHNYFAENILVHNKTMHPDRPDQDMEVEEARRQDCGFRTPPFAEPCAGAVLSDVGPPLEILSREAACGENEIALGGSFGDAVCPREDGATSDLTRDAVLYLPQASVEGLPCEAYDLVVSAVSGPLLLEFFEPGLDRCVPDEGMALVSQEVAGSEIRVPIPKTWGGVTLRLSPNGPEPLAVRLSLRARELRLDP